MRKERTLFFIGIWVALLPFLGFPNSWRKVLFIITGVALVYLSHLFKKETKARLESIRANKEIQTMESFIDNIETL